MCVSVCDCLFFFSFAIFIFEQFYVFFYKIRLLVHIHSFFDRGSVLLIFR